MRFLYNQFTQFYLPSEIAKLDKQKLHFLSIVTAVSYLRRPFRSFTFFLYLTLNFRIDNV